METRIRRLLSVALSVAMLFLLGGTFVSKAEATSKPSVADSAVIYKGKSKKIKISGKKKGASVSYSSSDPKVVTYKKGTAKGVSYGTATLITTVRQDGQTYELKTTVRVAGKNYSKAMKAYKKYLKKYPVPALDENKMYWADFNGVEEYGFYINSFFLRDMTSDGVPELFTMTRPNFRWEIIRVYTFSSSKVKLMKFNNGEKAIFDNIHTANGAYNTYFCTKNHIHNNYGGYYDEIKKAYRVKNGKLVPYDCDRSSHVDLYSSMYENTKEQRDKYLK